jgi:cephalosporin hydroxylase
MSNVIDDFHKLYYNNRTWKNTYWLGIPTQKCPLDLWIYQEIITKLKPDLIIETGTANGGSALYLASICDLIGKGKVLTIDVSAKKNRPKHRRINYLLGSSTSNKILEEVKRRIRKEDVILVILDSDHRFDHVLEELNVYSGLVSKGSYLIVEDTNINGHPVQPNWGQGPMEAVTEFLKRNDDFMIDEDREKFLLTFNPKGCLRKVK